MLRAAVRLDVAEVTGGRPGNTRLTSWIDGLGARPQERAAVFDQVCFEGPDSPSRVLRFALVMTFASVISAMGVLADSTAVVVGAMLIAPLISPMMGMGLSLAMGWPRRLARSAALVLLGIGIAVGTGALLGASSTLVATLVVGGIVLVLTGVAPLHRARTARGRVRTAFGAVLRLGVLVVVGLSLNGASITSDAVANDRARSEGSGWLGEDADSTVASVDVDGPDVRVILAGPGSPPSADALATRLSSRLDRRVALDLQRVPRERVRVVFEAG